MKNTAKNIFLQYFSKNKQRSTPFSMFGVLMKKGLAYVNTFLIVVLKMLLILSKCKFRVLINSSLSKPFDKI